MPPFYKKFAFFSFLNWSTLPKTIAPKPTGIVIKLSKSFKFGIIEIKVKNKTPIKVEKNHVILLSGSLKSIFLPTKISGKTLEIYTQEINIELTIRPKGMPIIVTNIMGTIIKVINIKIIPSPKQYKNFFPE